MLQRNLKKKDLLLQCVHVVCKLVGLTVHWSCKVLCLWCQIKIPVDLLIYVEIKDFLLLFQKSLFYIVVLSCSELEIVVLMKAEACPNERIFRAQSELLWQFRPYHFFSWKGFKLMWHSYCHCFASKLKGQSHILRFKVKNRYNRPGLCYRYVWIWWILKNDSPQNVVTNEATVYMYHLQLAVSSVNGQSSQKQKFEFNSILCK